MSQKAAWIWFVVLACALALVIMLSGCADLQGQLATSAAQKAVAETPTVLPPMPPECTQPTAHAPARIGEDAPVAVKAERSQTDAANASKARCAAFYEDIRAGLGPH